MTRTELESEISRLATEESKVVELQKRLDKKSSSWKALEVKRIEYAVPLAIHSMRLADIISGTKRCGRLYGKEYTADSDPDYFIRLGLRKSKIYRADDPNRSAAGAVGNTVGGCVTVCVKVALWCFACIAVIVIIGISVESCDNNFARSLENKDRLALLSLASSMVSDSEAGELIVKSTLSKDIPYLQMDKFIIHLRHTKRRYFYWDEIRQVNHAITLMNNHRHGY